MREIVVTSTGDRFAQDIGIGAHRLRADEEVDSGGTDTGPGPHELLLAALGACTSMTIRLYADRKGWLVRHVTVRLTGGSVGGTYVINRHLNIDGAIDAEQRQRLVEIANKCPVHRTLTGEVAITTTEGDV